MSKFPIDIHRIIADIRRINNGATLMTLREKIIEHFTNNPGVDIFYKTLGSTYEEAHPVFEQLFAEGVLERRKVPSKSGKRMLSKIFIASRG